MAAGKQRIHIDWQTWKSAHMRLAPDVWEAAIANHPDLIDRVEVTFSQDLENFEALAADAEILIGQKLPREHLPRMMPKLKWVSVTSAGVDFLLPLDWLPEGAVLTNNSGTHTPKTREYASMMLMAAHWRLPRLFAHQREHRWKPVFRPLVPGQTVLIYGYGTLGRASAEAAKALGFTVIGVRRSGEADEFADEMHRHDALAELLPRANILLIAAPLTPQTNRLFDGPMLDRLPEGAALINIGRGPILVTDAMLERLHSGKLSGAVLDVFEEEPLPADSPAWNAPNLIITPHMSSDDPETYIPRTLDLFCQNLRRWLNGEPLHNVVDPVHGY